MMIRLRMVGKHDSQTGFLGKQRIGVCLELGEINGKKKRKFACLVQFLKLILQNSYSKIILRTKEIHERNMFGWVTIMCRNAYDLQDFSPDNKITKFTIKYIK